MVRASARHAEVRGFDSRAGDIPRFFSVGIFAVQESIYVV